MAKFELAGVLLQAHLSKKTNESNSLSELQHKAYTDFLNTVSKIAVAQRAGDREVVSSELSKLADAKSRICIYGESTVIHKLAEFMRHGGTLQTESEILSFTKLCIVIRDSVGIKKDKLNTADISQLLFNLDVNDVPTPKND
jgi:hypothetical protein